jgi:hypothetical protein
MPAVPGRASHLSSTQGRCRPSIGRSKPQPEGRRPGVSSSDSRTASVRYGEVAPPAVVPPQVIVVPGPTAIPQYSGVPLPHPVVAPSYAVQPPVAVGVGAAPLRPCAPDGWRARCTPYPEHYPAPYEPLGPQVYPGPQTPSAAEPYSSQYAPHSGPIGPYASDRSPYRP